MWVCLKIVYPIFPMVLLIIIPELNGYLFGNIPYFQTNPQQFSSGYSPWKLQLPTPAQWPGSQTRNQSPHVSIVWVPRGTTGNDTVIFCEWKIMEMDIEWILNGQWFGLVLQPATPSKTNAREILWDFHVYLAVLNIWGCFVNFPSFQILYRLCHPIPLDSVQSWQDTPDSARSQ